MPDLRGRIADQGVTQMDPEYVPVRDFGIVDEVGSGESYTKTEVRLATRSGVRCLLVTMTYGVGSDCHWQTFTWLIEGDQLPAVRRDLSRVIVMTETGQGKTIWRRWISRLMAYDQGIRLQRDLGPVQFHNGQERAFGLVGEMKGPGASSTRRDSGPRPAFNHFLFHHSVRYCPQSQRSRRRAGNCWEWTSTRIAPAQGQEREKSVMAVKGGSWCSPRMSCRTEHRSEGRESSAGFSDVGFRVVRDR